MNEKKEWLLNMLDNKDFNNNSYINNSLTKTGVAFGKEIPFSIMTWRNISKKCEPELNSDAHESTKYKVLGK